MIGPTEIEMIYYLDEDGVTIEGDRYLNETPDEFAKDIAAHWDGSYPRSDVTRLKFTLPPIATDKPHIIAVQVEVQAYPLRPEEEQSTNTAMPDDPFAWRKAYANLQYGDMADLEYRDRLSRAQLIVDLPPLLKSSKIKVGDRTYLAMTGTRDPIDMLSTDDIGDLVDALRYPEIDYDPEVDKEALIAMLDGSSLDTLRESWRVLWKEHVPDLKPRSRRMLFDAKEKLRVPLEEAQASSIDDAMGPVLPPEFAPAVEVKETQPSPQPRNGEAVRLYRPSNSDEGFWFEGNFCERCEHNKDDPDNSCMILMRTMGFDKNDPEYPREWTYDDDGDPTCTAFELRRNLETSNKEDQGDEPRRNNRGDRSDSQSPI